MENWTFYGLANPPSGTNLDSWGHYTQLIWKSSTKVGCYTAKCPAGTVLSMQSWYTVCNYSPPGKPICAHPIIALTILTPIF